MTAPTHRVFAVGWVLIGNMILYSLNVSPINYYISMIIMLQIGKYGALFPDIDHSWQNVKEKTAPNFIINNIIHLTGGKHRSWQTHSLDIAILSTIIGYNIPIYLYNIQKIDSLNREILSIVIIGFCIGWLSHLFSDMLTSAGVRITAFSKRKIALVPKQLFGLRFNTGNQWEGFVYQSIKILNLVIGIIAIAYPLLRPYIILSIN